MGMRQREKEREREWNDKVTLMRGNEVSGVQVFTSFVTLQTKSYMQTKQWVQIDNAESTT